MWSVTFGVPCPCPACTALDDELCRDCSQYQEWKMAPSFEAKVSSPMMGAELALSLLSYMRDEGISSDGYKFDLHRW